MGQKVHPTGFRLGVTKTWNSRWYANSKTYKDVLIEDVKIRQHIDKELANASIARVEIERVAESQITVNIFTAKPGIVIGKNGEKVDRLRAALDKLTGKKVNPKILEIRTPEIEAALIGKSIAEQIEKRISFRRAMKQAVQKAMRSGAKGIKIICSGRLGGAEIARTEREVEGSVPLHTLRADIDFAITVAKTTYGTIGIKVWVYKGLILSGPRQTTNANVVDPTAQRVERPSRPPRQGGDRPNNRGRGAPARGGQGGRQGDRPPPRQGGAPQGARGPRPATPRPVGTTPEGAEPTPTAPTEQ